MIVQYYIANGEIRLRDHQHRTIILHKDYFNARRTHWGIPQTHLYSLPPHSKKISLPKNLFETLYKNIRKYLNIQTNLLQHKSKKNSYFPEIPRSSPTLNALEMQIEESEMELFTILQKVLKIQT